jgi:hypothetical protein
MGVLMGVLSSGNEESKLCVGQRRKQRGGITADMDECVNQERGETTVRGGGAKTVGDYDLRVFLVVEI